MKSNQNILCLVPSRKLSFILSETKVLSSARPGLCWAGVRKWLSEFIGWFDSKLTCQNESGERGPLGPNFIFAVDMMKTAMILEEEDEVFLLEYDNNLGQKNTMRLDAASYLGAVQEAKSYLGVDDKNLDGDGIEWKFD